MSSQNLLELRVRQIERELRMQRRVTAVLAALALVAGLAAFQTAQPQILSARRFEVVDASGMRVGAFGIGALGVGGIGDGDRLGWALSDPKSGACATAWVGQAKSAPPGGQRATAMIELEAGLGNLHAYAAERGAAVQAYHDDVRCAALGATERGSSLMLEGPRAESPLESGMVLHLSYESGKPTIKGWDDRRQPTIDIE